MDRVAEIERQKLLLKQKQQLQESRKRQMILDEINANRRQLGEKMQKILKERQDAANMLKQMRMQYHQELIHTDRTPRQLSHDIPQRSVVFRPRLFED